MSLPLLQWRKLPERFIPPNTTITSSYLLDTIYDILTGSAYYDGTARTAGVGSAWQQVTKFVTGSNTEAVYCFPPTKTIMSQSVIFSARSLVGASSSATPEVVTNEAAYATDLVFGACVKGAATESFTQWTSLFPFGSGSVSTKYAQWFRPSTLGSGSKITIYESTEALAGVIFEQNKEMTNIILLGAIIDPEQNVTATDAEADGRLYAVATSGVPTSATAGSVWTSTFWKFWQHGLSAGTFLTHTQTVAAASTFYSRFVMLTPQTGSLIPVEVMKFSNAGNSGGDYLNALYSTTYSGRSVRRTVYCVATGSYNFLGRLRDMTAFTAFQSGAVIKNTSNTVIGYTLAASEHSASATLLLNHS